MYLVVAMLPDKEEGVWNLWSHEFRSREAAQDCIGWLKQFDVQVTIFDDFEED
jgi:hypothetical protein